MNAIEIANALEADRSKRSIDALLKKLQGHPIDIRDFLNTVPSIEFPVRWYMTWFLTHYVEAFPEEGNLAQDDIWKTLSTCEHQGMQRDLWRTMTFIDISDNLSATIYDHAVKMCISQNNAIAVRAHAMLTAANIALPYAELREELCLILKDFDVEESAGLRARSRNLIKRLKN